MPRAPQPETEGPARRTATVRTGNGSTGSRSLEITPDIVHALRPWIDLERTGPEGLKGWLLSMLPLLPLPQPAPARERGRAAGDRVAELARALAECAGDRARVHFQAAEYFRENQALARRVRALEAMLALRVGDSQTGRRSDDEAEAAADHYLPKGRL